MTAPAHWPDGPLLSTPGLPMGPCFCWHNHPHRECLEHGQSDEIDALLDVVAWDSTLSVDFTWRDHALSPLALLHIRSMCGAPVRP